MPEQGRHTAEWLKHTAEIILRDGPKGLRPSYCELLASNLNVIADVIAERDRLLVANAELAEALTAMSDHIYDTVGGDNGLYEQADAALEKHKAEPPK